MKTKYLLIKLSFFLLFFPSRLPSLQLYYYSSFFPTVHSLLLDLVCYNPICRFISLNEIGLASPSSNTAALPTFTGGWPFGGTTTTPFLVLYLAAAAEVNTIVVMVVPGGGVGMRLCC